MPHPLLDLVWQQFGAAIAMLEQAIGQCPEALWARPQDLNPFWYVAFHTIFFLDHYADGSPEGFHPPAPFDLSELDPAGTLPERAYTREELLAYLIHARERCRAALRALPEDAFLEPCGFQRPALSRLELFLSTMRHVQHHTGQLNLLLREAGLTPLRWVFRSQDPEGNPKALHS